MKLWSTEHIFSHPWKKVTEAAWRKYPNEQNTNVVAIDVIDRSCTSNGCLQTTRIFGSHWNLPSVITTLFGMPEMCYAIEHSEVDMKNEKMTLKMINYTFWGMLACEELLIYEPNKENPNETSLTQSAKISVNGIQFSNYFEGLIASNFESTSKKGRYALEQVLNTIKIENMLDTVKYELNELSVDLEKATAKLDCDFHVTERLQKLSDDLDRAATFFNNEFDNFSTKIKLEFDQLVSVLNKDLHRMSVEVKAKNDGSRHVNGSIVNAVQQAGISVKSNSS